MRCQCPNCSHLFVQDRNAEGLNYCPQCSRLFLAPAERQVPSWVWGVLTVMVVNWQMLFRL